MKVLIANYRYFVSSGPERYLFNITAHLERQGHEVVPFSIAYAQNRETPYARYFVSPIGAADEVYFDQHKRSLATVPKTLARLYYSREVERAVGRLVEDTRPDVAYVLYYQRKLSPSLLVGLKKRGVPIVARISDYGMFCAELHCLREGRPCTLCQKGNPWHGVAHRCVKGSLPLSLAEAGARVFHAARGYFDLIDTFVVTNPFMLESMAEAGYPREKMVCVPTFTDVEQFSPPAGDAVRDYMVFVGRLDRPKGVDVLLEAIALLRGRGLDVPLLKIAGAGHNTNYVESLEALRDRLGLQDAVTFLGNVEGAKVPDLLRGAVCAAIPALWFENLPNTLLECLATGTPVVASDIGSLAASIEDGVDGLLARPGDPTDLADKLARVITDPALRARLGANARASALKTFSPESHVRSVLSVLENARRFAPAPGSELASIS